MKDILNLMIKIPGYLISTILLYVILFIVAIGLLAIGLIISVKFAILFIFNKEKYFENLEILEQDYTNLHKRLPTVQMMIIIILAIAICWIML